MGSYSRVWKKACKKNGLLQLPKLGLFARRVSLCVSPLARGASGKWPLQDTLLAICGERLSLKCCVLSCEVQADSFDETKAYYAALHDPEGAQTTIATRAGGFRTQEGPPDPPDSITFRA
ncbi:hypothetical protein cyc_07309 [Cyclospora cayetanensis]|uniref:Uncharacterized protein n=1 Tax=Cyclospora cayetanensis TaxID=88456 RepID=A0A1D3CTN3_9EIME|nr:hypothetical protein cyc_07309 [Cyclospora cayetanensis]